MVKQIAHSIKLKNISNKKLLTTQNSLKLKNNEFKNNQNIKTLYQKLFFITQKPHPQFNSLKFIKHLLDIYFFSQSC